MLLGDLIAKLTKSVGIQPCTPCQARQAKLNELHQRVMGTDDRTRAIQSIQCSVCRNYGWMPFMRPEMDALGAMHHPGCDAKAFVITTRG